MIFRTGVVIGSIAGGDGALRHAVEEAEDSAVGISAAGGAVYVLGAFDLAEEYGALTAAITSSW